MKMRPYLTNNSSIRCNPSIAPRDQSEVNNGDETRLEEPHKMVHYEISTIGT